MKRKAFFLLVILSFFMGFSINEVYAQHFIGLNKTEVINLMRSTHKNFSLDKAINHSFNYLKFVDALNEQTWLMFLTEDDICTSTKLMCDYILLDEKIAELNKNYTSTSSNIWEYSNNGKPYIITLEKGEWYFTIITKPKVKK